MTELSGAKFLRNIFICKLFNIPLYSKKEGAKAIRAMQGSNLDISLKSQCSIQHAMAFPKIGKEGKVVRKEQAFYRKTKCSSDIMSYLILVS